VIAECQRQKGIWGDAECSLEIEDCASRQGLERRCVRRQSTDWDDRLGRDKE
jgi:hypothetical protein